jgi:5'-nucleotidase
LLTSKVTIADGATGTAVGGRPADCVKLAVAKLLPRAPDLVVSGINSGANVGVNVIYSGTVAAAIEASFLGLPSIALSLYLRSEIPTDYARTAIFSREVIEQCLANGLQGGQCVSVNLPPVRETEVPAGVRVVRQCVRPWADTYEQRADPRGRAYFWNSTVFALGKTEEDTDVAALRDGYITVTPLQFDLTQYAMLREWETKNWRMSKSE